MAAAPPFAMGNMVSTTRMPVISGRWAGMRCPTGRGRRMGQVWHRVSSCSLPRLSRSFTTVSVTVYCPSGAVQITSPATSGATMHLCRMTGVSGQVA